MIAILWRRSHLLSALVSRISPRSPSTSSHAALIWIGMFCVLFVPLLVGCRKGSPELGAKEAPNPLVAKQVAGISGTQIARNAAEMLKGASIDPAVINKAMGGFVYQASSSYASTRKTRTVKFNEKVKLTQHPEGPFHILVNNDQQKSAEVIWHTEKLYWRGKGRPFRVTSEDVEMARRWQIRSYGQWRALVAIFGESIQLEDQGEEQVAGRTCRAYRITLRSVTDASLPEIPEGTAWSGKLPEHTRGKAANKPRLPSQASGTLCADTQLGFPLKVKFQGRYRVGKDEADIAVTLDASFSRASSEEIKPPKTVVTVSREPDPLDAFAKKKPTFFLEPPVRRPQ